MEWSDAVCAERSVGASTLKWTCQFLSAGTVTSYLRNRDSCRNPGTIYQCCSSATVWLQMF